MGIPGYTAEISLYRGGRPYRTSGSLKTTHATAAGLTPAQMSRTDCIALCLGVAFGSSFLCGLGGEEGVGVCLAGVALSTAGCIAMCPPEPASAGGGGGGGPRGCPSGVCCEWAADGKTCRICQPVHGACP
jgi:hypothetical protein